MLLSQCIRLKSGKTKKNPKIRFFYQITYQNENKNFYFILRNITVKKVTKVKVRVR